jgi:hypothetical protein
VGDDTPVGSTSATPGESAIDAGVTGPNRLRSVLSEADPAGLGCAATAADAGVLRRSDDEANAPTATTTHSVDVNVLDNVIVRRDPAEAAAR